MSFKAIQIYTLLLTACCNTGLYSQKFFKIKKQSDTTRIILIQSKFSNREHVIYNGDNVHIMDSKGNKSVIGKLVIFSDSIIGIHHLDIKGSMDFSFKVSGIKKIYSSSRVYNLEKSWTMKICTKKEKNLLEKEMVTQVHKTIIQDTLYNNYFAVNIIPVAPDNTSLSYVHRFKIILV
jgi:hypothetical protein